jgi:hypothetical protein
VLRLEEHDSAKAKTLRIRGGDTAHGRPSPADNAERVSAK